MVVHIDIIERSSHCLFNDGSDGDSQGVLAPNFPALGGPMTFVRLAARFRWWFLIRMVIR
jgi:hypothetical protein